MIDDEFKFFGPPRQDFILLAGLRSPGQATVTKAGAPRKWDERTGYATSGAWLIFMGSRLTNFDVVLEMTDDDTDWLDEQKFMALLETPPIGQRATSYQIIHPALNRAPVRVTSAVVLDASQWEQDDLGLWTMRINFQAFRAPLPAIGKPTASIHDAAKKVPTVRDARDEKIQRLMQQTNELGGGL